MKKLMIIMASLMMAGAVSAHGGGYGYHGGGYGYHGGYGFHERVVVQPYGYCAPRPMVVVRPAPYYYGGYGRYNSYRGCHNGYYR